MKTRCGLTTTIALLLPTPLALHAVTDTWDGGGANDNLSTALNWLDNTAPASDLVNTDLIFAGVVRLTPNIGAVFDTDSITFDETAGAFSIGGSQLNVGAGGIVQNSFVTQTFTNAVSFSGVAASAINCVDNNIAFLNTVTLPTGTLTIPGTELASFRDISGTATLLMSGGGTMSLSPSITQNYDLVINSGVVTLVLDLSSDTFGAGASIAVNGTSVFNVNQNLTLDGGAQLTRASGAAVNFAAGKSFTVQNGSDALFTGAANLSAGSVLVTGAGSTVQTTGPGAALSIRSGLIALVQSGGALTSTGTLDVGTSGDGTLSVDGAGATASAAAGTSVWGGSGATASVAFSNDATGSFGAVEIGRGNVAGSSGSVLVLSGADVTSGNLFLGNTGGLAATGELTVSGSGSTWMQTVTLSTLNIGAATGPSGTLNVESSGTFRTGGGLTTVHATGAINITNGTFQTIGNLTLDGGNLTRSSGGSFTIQATRTFTVQGGGVASFGGAQGLNGVNVVVTGAGSVIATTASTLVSTGNGTIQVSNGGHIDSAANIMIAGASSGLRTVTVDGAGSRISAPGSDVSTLGGNGGVANVTFSNDAVGIFGVSLQLGAGTAAGSAGTVLVQSGADVTSGQLQLTTHNAATSGTITVTGAGSTWTMTGSSTLTIGTATDSTAALHVNSSGVFSTGLGDAFVNATGTLAIAGGTFNANDDLIVNGGQLTRDPEGTFALAAGRTLTVQAGGDATFTGSYTNSTASAITVTGAGSTLTTTGFLALNGGIALHVLAGGSVNSGASEINIATSIGDATVDVDGSGSSLAAGTLAIAQSGHTGSVSFLNGGTGTFGAILVDSSTIAGTDGTLSIQSGASVTAGSLIIAPNASANSGVVTITGPGSALTLTGAATATIGAASNSIGTLNVESGGTFTTGTGLTDVRATGDINVNAGGTMIVRGNMNVANSLDIANGGTVILGGSAPPAPALAMDEIGASAFGAGEIGAATTIVPEPGIGALLASALALLGARRPKERRFPTAGPRPAPAGTTLPANRFPPANRAGKWPLRGAGVGSAVGNRRSLSRRSAPAATAH
jgi:T5SS/PEP-CTERM-associated repeat protein